ncbi:hypothetical protein BBP40_012595 [Aspergillus hancockii]|nr:hypothetical protein BBP40_012595 [Aspergillus hancockii]
MAIEDAAALTNLLSNLLKNQSSGLPADKKIENFLRRYRDIRYGRVHSIYRTSRFVVRFMARDGLLNTLFGRYYAPFAGDISADIASEAIANGQVCELLPLPERNGTGWDRYQGTSFGWVQAAQAGFGLLILLAL